MLGLLFFFAVLQCLNGNPIHDAIMQYDESELIAGGYHEIKWVDELDQEVATRKLRVMISGSRQTRWMLRIMSVAVLPMQLL